ncbi:MAG TPA: MFS transporter [Burkholderiaceae bacterium]|nr:MFS transporter [Burkholderiaceae bacterium]
MDSVQSPAEQQAISSIPKASTTLFFALLVGVAVLPLFASQAMIDSLDTSLHLGTWTSLVTALTLLGYAVGLIGLVPLVDRLPIRILAGTTLVVQLVALILATCVTSPGPFLVVSFVIGVASSTIQMLIPAAAALTGPALRGKVIGNVMSGLMIGILLSRPLASYANGTIGWRGFYLGDAMLLATALILALPRIPNLRPSGKPSYLSLIASMGKLIVGTPVLQHRALSQGLLMAGFNAFWTSVAVVLYRPPFGLHAAQIALFALAGAGSVIVAPLAGQAGDRGHANLISVGAHFIALIGACFAICALNSALSSNMAVVTLAVAACLIDGAVIAEQTIGRRAINLLAPETRGRLNGLFTGLFFIGSACGAACAGPVYAKWGWVGVCALAGAFFLAAGFVHQLFLFKQRAVRHHSICVE